MRWLFIHIPKNGGMTIRAKTSKIRKQIIVADRSTHISPQYSDAVKATMDKHRLHHGFEHARWRDIKPELTSQYKTFAIVRNPWSRVVSRYTFALLGARKGKVPHDYSLEQFLEERHKWGGKPYFWHRAIHGWYPQKDYVTDESGKLRCDILRFEHFNEDTVKYFGLSEPLDIRNPSQGERSDDNKTLVGRKDYRDYYTNTAKEIVADWYRRDIDFWGFTFDSTATKNTWATP